jgi:type II secretory pathway pseudopilin PulG
MFCSRCGAQLNPGVPVCPSCGQGVAVPAKGRTSTVIIVVAVIAALGLMAVVIIGIIAAIAIPSLLRARISANESMAIGNLRTIISGEAAYQSANGGFSDVPACLFKPDQCLGSNVQGITFLDPASVVFDVPKGGYVLQFHGGPAPADTSAVSPSSLEAFAVTAEPANPQGGVRVFCGDSRGIVCVMAASSRITEDGQCPETCAALR